jgi:general stress protein YciG
MAGNRIGGIKARDKNLANNPNFYKEIGRKGGKSPSDKPRGFATISPERLREISAKGGRISRRGKGRAK